MGSIRTGVRRCMERVRAAQGPWRGPGESALRRGRATVILPHPLPRRAGPGGWGTRALEGSMRTLLLLSFIVGGLIVVGAIHVSRSGDEVDVSIDTQKVRVVAGEVLREGEAVLETAGQPGTKTTR
jgi:hypothetical protein